MGVSDMGESWKEGERNFWDGRQSVTATTAASSSKKKMAQPNPSNIEEMKELRGEGGSDVFTSTRHINNTPETSNASKMKFWSTDDAPLIRPILNKSVYMAHPWQCRPWRAQSSM